jgi:NADPH-dependent glutamate synthase beta subunit-like oxidoreductase
MAELEKQMLAASDWYYNEFGDLQWIPAPCQKACPVGTDAPSYIGLIWEGKYEEALEAITATNPFSSVCGRVCAKPCETECRRGESDGSVAIRGLKRFVMDRLGNDFHLPEVAVHQQKTIGIVGGGPTGLTAAQDLAEAGYEVHIYEKSDRLGGMINAIPQFRLPQNQVEEDITRVLDHCPGIHVHLNTTLGKETTLDALKEKHDAVLLAVGLWRDRGLGIPGEAEATNGIYGIKLLTDMMAGQNAQLPEKVVVVGGGNVAMDMARTALRLGARDVQLFCLESREEMPAWNHEIKEAEEEGIVIHPGWGPKEILLQNGRVKGLEFKRCVSVFDDEGRFNPAYDEATIQTVDAGAVLLAIGLMGDNDELKDSGLMQRGFVKADLEGMQTVDPQVFAAGDCAFGPSAVVYAMNHGHRAAYYIKAYLEGRKNPLPYRVPWRTRGVPVTQDPDWEKLPLEPQIFCGFQEDKPFDECEETYSDDVAHRQAARCLRCDTETGASDYSRRTREHLHAMARTEPKSHERLRAIALERLKPRDNPFPSDRPAHIDDLVFLSAALTRLVIDPYREHCDTTTPIGKSLSLDQPFFFTGFDEAPDDVRRALAQGLAETNCGYMGFHPLGEIGQFPWLQLIVPGKTTPSADAEGLIYVLGSDFEPVEAKRLKDDQLLGLAVKTTALQKAIPWALEKEWDVLILDGTSGMETSWVELEGFPDLTVMRDAIHILRNDLDREEDIALVYFGGLRSGTDIAKVLAINCNAGVFNVAAALGLGGVEENGQMAFDGGMSVEERIDAVRQWIKATADESAIIARCTGKTYVHNLEPEDMRSITLATSKATNIPTASGTGIREEF